MDLAKKFISDNIERNLSVSVVASYCHMSERQLSRIFLEIAQKIYERHTLLSDFLIRLGVDPAIAAEDACKMEHDISDTSFEAIKRHVNAQKQAAK